MPPNRNPYTMQNSPTVETAYKPTRRNVRGLGKALYLSFTTHPLNSEFRKRLTLVMFLTWGFMTVLRTAEFVGIEPIIYWPLTVSVFSIFFHMWGFEYGAIAAADRVNPADGLLDDGDVHRTHYRKSEYEETKEKK